MFNSEWLFHPELSDWVSGLPDEDVAFCKVCNKEISCYNGISALKAHGKGIRHTELLYQSQRGVTAPRPKQKKKSLHVPNERPSTSSSVNFNFVNMPSSSAAAPPRIHQGFLPSRSERDRSPIRIAQHSSNNNCWPSTSSTSSYRRENKANKCIEQVEVMLSQHSSLIESDVVDFMKFYKESPRFRTLSTSSQFDRYSTVKSILDDYKSQHEILLNKIKKRLVGAFIK